MKSLSIPVFVGLVLAVVACKRPPTAPRETQKPTPEVNHAQTDPGLTGEEVNDANRALAMKQGPGLPEALAEPPPVPELRVLTRLIYVSPTALQKGKGLTPDSPVPVTKAAYMSEPGDIILFAEGEYTAPEGKTILTIERSGTADRPIVFAPAPGAKVTFRSRFAWEAIKVSGASHIVVRNFRVIGSAGEITMDEAWREMSNLKSPRTCGNGIGIARHPGSKAAPAHVTIRDCVVSDFPGGGIFANHCDYITFENNVVFRCAFWSPFGNSGLSIYQPIAVDDSTDYKIVIRNNVAFGNYQNIPFYHSNRKDPSKRKWTDGNGIILDDFLNSQSWGGGSGKPYAGRTLVANNVVFANGGSGIHTFKASHVDIVHNYAADNNRHPTLKDGQIFANTSKDIRILNNVMVAPAGKTVTSSNKNTDLVQDHNLYANTDGSEPKFAGEMASNVVAAPGLTLTGWLTGGRTFQAAADSPLRGAGKPFPGAGADFFGKTRLANDIGPFVLGAP